MRRKLLMFPVVMLSTLAACGTSSVSNMPVANAAPHAIQLLAMTPSQGLLAEAVAVELSNRGYKVFDPVDTSRIMARLNLNEIEISQPEGLAKLRAQGIDALLSVRSAGGYDQMPQSATARVTSTHTGRVIAGVTWQNGWGGQAGSIADRVMRTGLTGAAKEIADGLTRRMPQS